MRRIEVNRIAIGEVVGDADDGGRGDNDEQCDARDGGEGAGADGVNAKREQRALRLGNHEEIPRKQERHGDEGGHEPLDAPFDERGLERGLLVAVDAAGADERPDAGQRGADAGAQQQARPVGGIEECIPELAGFMAGAGDGEPRVARREHEGENAVDDDERADRRGGIDPAHGQVQLGVDAVPRVVVDDGGRELDQEEDPLDGPAEDEVVNQRAGGLRVGESDGEPDAHAGDCAEDAGEDEEELRVADKFLEPVGAAFAQGLALGQRQIKPAAHRELRDHDVEDGDDADHPARAEIRNVPEWIVHKS